MVFEDDVNKTVKRSKTIVPVLVVLLAPGMAGDAGLMTSSPGPTLMKDMATTAGMMSRGRSDELSLAVI